MAKHESRMVHGSGKAVRAIGFAIMCIGLILAPAMFASATQNVIEFDAILFNASRTGNPTLNEADPDVFAHDMWQDRPQGVYFGPSLPSDRMMLKDWVTAENDTLSVGTLVYLPAQVIMSGAAEYWVEAPIVTHPDLTLSSRLLIYLVPESNTTLFNLSALGDPVADVTINTSNHNQAGVHNGYTKQLGQWAKLQALGVMDSSPYLSYFHVYSPLYPGRYYWIEQVVTYSAPSPFHHPEILLSDEDVFNDDHAFVYLTFDGATSTMAQDFNIDPHFAFTFVAGQTHGRAMIPITMSPGDNLIVTFTPTTSDARWRSWVIPLYPDLDTTYWNVSYIVQGTATFYYCLINQTLTLGGLIISSNTTHTDAFMIGLTLTYLGSPSMADVTIFPPNVDNITIQNTVSGPGGQYWSESSYTLWDETYTDMMAINWTMGVLEMFDTSPIDLNGTLTSTSFNSPVAYSSFNNRNHISITGGKANGESETLFRSISTTVIMVGTQIYRYSPVGLSRSAGEMMVDEIKGRFPGSDGIPEEISRLANELYAQVSGLAQRMFNRTADFIQEFVLGEIVDRITMYWETMKTYFTRIMDVVREIKTIVQKVINTLISALEYAIGITMKIFAIIATITVPICALSMFFAAKWAHKYTRAKDPTSKYYGGI